MKIRFDNKKIRTLFYTFKVQLNEYRISGKYSETLLSSLRKVCTIHCRIRKKVIVVEKAHDVRRINTVSVDLLPAIKTLR